MSVIAALMLTLQVTVFSTVTMVEWQMNEYRTCLVFSLPCRYFVADKLYQNEEFMATTNEINFSPPVCTGNSTNLICTYPEDSTFNVINR